MTTQIDEEKFASAHRSFLAWMQKKSDGIPFNNFSHPFLFKSEIVYKCKAFSDGQKAISFRNWKRWLKKPGQILEATKKACAPNISANLLEHQYGSKGNSYAALYRVETEKEVSDLENELYKFLMGGDRKPESLGVRFDNFADYLRKHSLGCKWTFVAYLCFLLDPMLYFPVLPDRFQKLMYFYGINVKFSGKVEWSRYLAMLNMAEQLKEKLSIYGSLNAIEIQSYIYVTSGLLKHSQGVDPQPSIIDFQNELEKRIKRAAEKERIGFWGEEFIMDVERKKLIDANRVDLAWRVKCVSKESASFGYDILSYNINGDPIHIEVKTTTKEKTFDDGFWLSETERLCAESDSNWTVYRVWAVNTSPYYEDIGNIIKSGKDWDTNPASWYVSYVGSKKKTGEAVTLLSNSNDGTPDKVVSSNFI